MDINLTGIRMGSFAAVPTENALPATAGAASDTESAQGWKTLPTGSDALAGISGEEQVDESALRRDDDLGKLAVQAFDASVASASLPPLDLAKILENA